MANEDTLIQQPERLFTVRPRSAAISSKDWVGGAGNRGTRARIRLLSSDTIKSQQQRINSIGFTSSEKRDYVANRMLNSNPGAGFSDFLLTSVNVNLTEKVQITQTFGDSETVYYFGKAPVIFNLGGMLIDDLDNQWFTTFVEAYTHIMRGTELARNFELIEIILPNMIVVGTVMGFSYQQEAGRDTDIPFTMQIHAKELRPVPVQIPAYAFTYESAVIDFTLASKLSNFTSMTQINSLKANAQKIKDAIQNPLSSTADIKAASERASELQDSIGWYDSSLDGPFGSVVSGAVLPGNTNTTGSTASSVTTLEGFKASLFSPVFGVLTSITKVIKTVTGDISKIISSFTNPVNNVLRDIQGIATQAIAVVRLVEKSVNDVVNVPLRTLNEVRNTVIALRNAAGVISRVPETIAQSIKRLTRFGSLKTSAAFLTKGGTKPGSKASLLNSGPTYSTAGASTVRR
jgi:hypothetical protein